MKYTVIQFAYDGCVEGDCPPVVRKGHMTLEEATAFAEEYGDEYDWVSCVPCSNDSAAFYANFSHDEKPPLDDDGAVQEEFKGSLELWFYHDELQEPKDDHRQA